MITKLEKVTFPEGGTGDIYVDSVSGEVIVDPGNPDVIVDLRGFLALPAPAEIHAHLDKALLTRESPALITGGGLLSAIEQMKMVEPDQATTLARARRAVEQMVQNGYTLIRTHVDITGRTGLSSMLALLELKAWATSVDLVDMEIVGLFGSPITGLAGASNRSLLAEAVKAGIDAVGGCPWLDPRPREALDLLAEAAAAEGLPLDMHTDETTDPGVLTITDLIDIEHAGFADPITASHCVSLASQSPPVLDDLAERLAAAGITVAALPQTNLYLQGWEGGAPIPRAVAPIRRLASAGVRIAVGQDNVADPFYPLGRMDALETASLAVASAHLAIRDSWAATSENVRTALGRRPAGFQVGDRADILAVKAESLATAMASTALDRVVIHNGRIVSTTTCTATLETPRPQPFRDAGDSL